MPQDSFPQLPPMNRLLAHPSTERLLVQFNRENVVQGCRDILDELRRALTEGYTIDPEAVEVEAILARLESRLAAASRVGLQRVVNASGLLLHTHLGRALLPQSAVDAVVRAATQPLNLEYDLAQGDRGPREETIADLLMDLTGAEGGDRGEQQRRRDAAGAEHARDRARRCWCRAARRRSWEGHSGCST